MWYRRTAGSTAAYLHARNMKRRWALHVRQRKSQKIYRGMGVDTTVNEVDAAARPIGEVLEGHAASHACDGCVRSIQTQGIYSWRRDKNFIGQAAPSDSVFPLTVAGVCEGDRPPRHPTMAG